MRTRYRVDSEKFRFEANRGSASIVLELSRAGSIRSARSRAASTGPSQSSSSSSATSSGAGTSVAEAAADGIGRRGIKLAE